MTTLTFSIPSQITQDGIHLGRRKQICAQRCSYSLFVGFICIYMSTEYDTPKVHIKSKVVMISPRHSDDNVLRTIPIDMKVAGVVDHPVNRGTSFYTRSPLRTLRKCLLKRRDLRVENCSSTGSVRSKVNTQMIITWGLLMSNSKS